MCHTIANKCIKSAQYNWLVNACQRQHKPPSCKNNDFSSKRRVITNYWWCYEERVSFFAHGANMNVCDQIKKNEGS